jgi:hypothetical protein
MSALRCKEIIDNGAAVSGLMVCLVGAVSLNGAQGREPSEAQVEKFNKAKAALEEVSLAIIDSIQPAP